MIGNNIIDGYRKIEGRYPTYREYLINFYCNDCSNLWSIDEKDIMVVDDDLSNIEDIIEDSVYYCPLCGSKKISRSRVKS